MSRGSVIIPITITTGDTMFDITNTWDMDKFIRAEKESALTNTKEVTMLITKSKKTKMDYPCLGESITTGLVVLFSSKGVGTVVIGSGVHAIGDYSTIWKMDTFLKPYKLITKE